MDETFGKNDKRNQKMISQNAQFNQNVVRYGIPFCTIFLVLSMTLVFLMAGSLGAKCVSIGAVFGFAIFEEGQIYRLITGMFFHADMAHIFSNMLLLGCLGKIMEKEFGHIRMLLFYFLPGILGNLASAFYFFEKREAVETIGASAGIYGLLGVALFLCIANRGEFENITIPRILLFLLLSVFEGMMSMNVDIVAHSVGFLSGLVLAGIMIYPKNQRRRMGERVYEV